jgi:hypothetical protein
VQGYFTKSGGGCSAWQTIVDAVLAYIAAYAAALGVEAIFLDGDKSLGRGARFKLPLRLYLAVRIALEHQEAAAHAMARGRFEIDDGDAVKPLVISLARGYCTQDQGWRSILIDA